MGFHTQLAGPPTHPLSPVIPNNVWTVRLTAAAGTNLARPSSEDSSDPGDSPLHLLPSPALKTPSIERPLSVEPRDFTSDLGARLHALYAQ